MKPSFLPQKNQRGLKLKINKTLKVMSSSHWFSRDPFPHTHTLNQRLIS